MSHVHVSLTAGPEIHGVIEQLEARARDYELEAAQCREAAATMRKVFGVSPLMPAAPVAMGTVSAVIQQDAGRLHIGGGAVARDSGARCAEPHQTETQTRPRRVPRAGVMSRTRPPIAPRGTETDLQRQILACLEQQTAPMRVHDLHGRLKFTGARTTLRSAVTALVESGQVIRRGTTASVRIGVPRVMGANNAQPSTTPLSTHLTSQQRADRVLAALAGNVEKGLSQLITDTGLTRTLVLETLHALTGMEQVLAVGDRRYRLQQPHERTPRAPVKSITPTAAVNDAVLLGEITRVLQSGASYDVRDILRNVRSACPTVEVPTIEAALMRLAAEQRIERIPVGSTIRFRAFPKKLQPPRVEVSA